MVRRKSNLGRRSIGARRVVSLRNRANNEQVRVPVLNRRLVLQRAAFAYDPTIDYAAHKSVVIGAMNQVCKYCKALKFKGEPAGLCCVSGQVKLPDLMPPPEPLRSLLLGGAPMSSHFLSNIQSYNSCFQMTSFGATNIIRDNYMPTFKVISKHNINYEYFDENTSFDCENFDIQQIQGQVYHRLGSLLPFPDQSYQFLQIYFVGNSNVETDRRCNISSKLRRDIVQRLQVMLHDENELVRLFQNALDQMTSDEYAIVIRPDKVPPGQHARRFNAPTMQEVAIVIVGDEFNSRDIVLRRRDLGLQRVSETHRCYDGLQYPLLFSRGEDGYHFNIKMINPSTG